MAASRLGGRGIRLSEGPFAWLLVAPAVGAIVAVVAIPLAYSLWLSFTDVNLLRTTGPAVELAGVRIPLFRWIGGKNYAQALTDPLYWDSLWRTLYFVAAFVAEATLVGLGMALVLHERFPGRPVMRSRPSGSRSTLPQAWTRSPSHGRSATRIGVGCLRGRFSSRLRFSTFSTSSSSTNRCRCGSLRSLDRSVGRSGAASRRGSAAQVTALVCKNRRRERIVV